MDSSHSPVLKVSVVYDLVTCCVAISMHMKYRHISQQLTDFNRLDSTINDAMLESVRFIISCKCQCQSYRPPIILAQPEKEK